MIPSQTEKTIIRHSSRDTNAPSGQGKKREAGKKNFWGCGGEYDWWDKPSNWPTFPNTHQQQVHECANGAQKKYIAKRKKRRKKRCGFSSQTFWRLLNQSER